MRSTRTVFERSAPDAAVVERALAGARHTPFWLDDVERPARPSLHGDHDTDLAVVGGGYCGLWTAVHAKRRDPGRRVVVLEGRRVGWAASGRNGGFCDASLTHGRENGLSRWPDDVDRLDELGARNLDELERAVADLDLDCQFERTGMLEVAVEPHQVGWLGERAASGEGELLDEAAVRREVDSPTYLAGLWSREGTALVHPARLALGLARAAEALGVEVLEHTPVDAVTADRHGGRVTLQTPAGVVRADRVALCTNAFPSLLRRYRFHTVPVYDYALMTEPLSSEQRASLRWENRQGLGDTANQFHYYRLSADDRMLFGGYDAVYRAGGRVRAAHDRHPESFRRLASHLLTTFPQLEDVGISHAWGGPIDTSTRFCAFVGTGHGGRTAHAAGFTGLGVAATHFVAQVLLDRLDGIDSERAALPMMRSLPLPFPPEPLASVGIQLTRWSLDRADHREGRRNPWLRALDAAGLGFDS